MNSTGPRTLPWGTPLMTGLDTEQALAIRTYCTRLIKKVANPSQQHIINSIITSKLSHEFIMDNRVKGFGIVQVNDVHTTTTIHCNIPVKTAF